MSSQAWSLLRDRPACVQAINHLKLGVSPWRGLDYLSVGLDQQKRVINEALTDARRGGSRTLVVQLEYGFGKTHLLRLARELAELMGFVSSHITHDPLRNVSFNKPINVFSEIVTELCREYPHDAYRRVMAEIPPSYMHHHQFRYRHEISERLSDLGAALAPPDRRGLLVLVDELEGLTTASMPNRRSREISYEVLASLMSRQSGPKGCVVIMAVTPTTLERFEDDWHDPWRANRPRMRFPHDDIAYLQGGALNVADALTLHSRIHDVHAVARNRQPINQAILSGLGRELIRMCQQNDGLLHYRTFIQACVTDFDVRDTYGTAGLVSESVVSALIATVRPVAIAPAALPAAASTPMVAQVSLPPVVPRIPDAVPSAVPGSAVSSSSGPPSSSVPSSGDGRSPNGSPSSDAMELAAYLDARFPTRSSHDDIAVNADAILMEFASRFPRIFDGVPPAAVRSFLQNMLDDNGSFRLPNQRSWLFVAGEIDAMRRTSQLTYLSPTVSAVTSPLQIGQPVSASSPPSSLPVSSPPMTPPANHSSQSPHDNHSIIERMELVPGTRVTYQSPLGLGMGAVIVSVDWTTRTARVRLTRIPLETNVGIDRLSAKG